MKKIPAKKDASDAPAAERRPVRKPRKGAATSGTSVAAENPADVVSAGELPFPEYGSAGRNDSDAAQIVSTQVEGAGSEATAITGEVVDSGGSVGAIEKPDTSDQSGLQAWCFLTNRTNLLSILGIGAITRSEEAWRYAPDSRDVAAGAIPIWRGLTPRSLVPLLDGSGADSPVILEFSDEVRKFIPGSSGSTCVVHGPIPFAAVSRVRFKDRNTLEDFKLKAFDDTPTIPDTLLVDSLGTSPGFSDAEFTALLSPEQSSARLDKVLGGLIAITDSLAGRGASCRFYCALVDALAKELRATGSFVASIASQISDARLASSSATLDGDLWLLGETLRFLDGVDPDIGLDPVAFVDHVEARLHVETKRVGGADVSQILTWCRYTKQLLNGNEEVKQLSDAKSIVQRAVLLFLIRPEQHRFRKIDRSNINPGSRVYLLASLFMGYFVGLQRTESLLKRTGRWYFEFVEHFITHRGGDALAGEHTTLVQSSDGRGQFTVFHGALELAKFEIGLSDSLQQVFHQVRRAGLQSRYDVIDQEVCCSLPGQSAVDVKIGLVVDPIYGETIRFYGECIRVPQNTEQLGQLAIMLLERNATPGIHGRFAIARGGKQIIYVQDQLLDTMDRSELEAHIRHVADVTARFRTEFSNER